MLPFYTTRHKADYDYLLYCYEKYNCGIEKNDWKTACYIISGIELTDLFLAVLRDDLTIDYSLLVDFIYVVPKQKQPLFLYAIQQCGYPMQLTSFNDVLQTTSNKELTMLIHAVDSNYFQKKVEINF